MWKFKPLAFSVHLIMILINICLYLYICVCVYRLAFLIFKKNNKNLMIYLKDLYLYKYIRHLKAKLLSSIVEFSQRNTSD